MCMTTMSPCDVHIAEKATLHFSNDTHLSANIWINGEGQFHLLFHYAALSLSRHYSREHHPKNAKVAY